MRGHLQSKILSTQLYRRCILWHQLPQHPLPGLSGVGPSKDAEKIRTQNLWLSSACFGGAYAVAGREEGGDEGPVAS